MRILMEGLGDTTSNPPPSPPTQPAASVGCGFAQVSAQGRSALCGRKRGCLWPVSWVCARAGGRVWVSCPRHCLKRPNAAGVSEVSAGSAGPAALWVHVGALTVVAEGQGQGAREARVQQGRSTAARGEQRASREWGDDGCKLQPRVERRHRGAPPRHLLCPGPPSTRCPPSLLLCRHSLHQLQTQDLPSGVIHALEGKSPLLPAVANLRWWLGRVGGQTDRWTDGGLQPR